MNCKTCKYSSLPWYEEPCKSCCSGYEPINGKENELKLVIEKINTRLTNLEELLKKDIKERINEAYQQGVNDAWDAALGMDNKLKVYETGRVDNIKKNI